MEKNKKKDFKDTIIKLVLIIIIILLLLHNCVLIKKKGKEKTPSGNVNIIEIMCEDNEKCDVKPTDNQNDDNQSNNTSTNEGEVSSSNIRNNSQSNNTSSTNKNNNSSSNNEGTSTNQEQETDGKLSVFDDKLVWNNTTELKIFTNSVYNFEEKIAPESSNTYQFVVKNSTAYKLKYNISFIETNPYNINMKYKLKKNNTYLVDHYVSYNELNINNQLLNAKKNDTFYLEWKWISSNNDNEAGENSANYALKIKVEAESTND